jgi:hypothetical protein
MRYAERMSLLPLPRRAALLLLPCALAAGLTGCHSHYIDATLRNANPGPITVVELDYPSASFGRDLLAPGAEYHYRFKVLGNGPTKILWTDDRHIDHTVPGPTLHEGDEGRLTVTLTSTATWDVALQPR